MSPAPVACNRSSTWCSLVQRLCRASPSRYWGPEMHHFEMSYRSSQALASAAERRFKSNKGLYERKAISESQWLEISEQYYALALEYEHMRHFFELVVDGDDDADARPGGAAGGRIDYSSADRARRRATASPVRACHRYPPAGRPPHRARSRGGVCTPPAASSPSSGSAR